MAKIVQTTKNRGLWLKAFDEDAQVIDLPMPSAGPGAAVVQVLGTLLTPYTRNIHTGKQQMNLLLPCVPNPNSIARIHEVGPDATTLRPGKLVYVDSTLHARDDPEAMIMQGHHGGLGTAGKALQAEWRDGSLQRFQKVPIENCYDLDEETLCHQLGYSMAELTALPLYAVAAGAICETAELKIGETVIIGPAGGSFGGSAVEIALAVGANVIMLGRDEKKLAAMRETLGNPRRLQYVVMTGDKKSDVAAIMKVVPDKAGADVYNDWTPGGMTPLYLATAVETLKRRGRVVLSGGASGAAEIPYGLMVHKDLKVMGKWMHTSDTFRQVVSMVSSGILKIGRNEGAEVTEFSLDKHEKAVANAEAAGGWRNYTIVIPN